MKPTQLATRHFPPPKTGATSTKDAVSKPPIAAPPFYRRRGVTIAAMVALPAAFVLSAWFIANAWNREGTDDAFVDGNVVNIAPRVAGKVLRLSINDNELVQQGAPLFEIDPADFQARVDQDTQTVSADTATSASKEAAYEQALAHSTTASKIVESSIAGAKQAQAEAWQHEDDLARYKALVETGVISEKEYDDSSKSTLASLAAYSSKVADQSASQAYEAESDRQIAAAKAQWQAAAAQTGAAKAALEESKLQLSYTDVVAPVAGRVTERTVNTGDYLNVGQQVMALVPLQVWVTANFKETQLTHMQPGQAAEVRVDAYPHHLFHGHVDSIQAGSGAQFSLLPPENATGNYVKVVQRVPVKIVLDDPVDREHVLGPGMSVEPTVIVSDSRVPMTVAMSLAAFASTLVVVGGIRRLRSES